MSWKRHHFFVLAVVLVSLGLVAWWALPGSAPEEMPTRTPARNVSAREAPPARSPELPEFPTKTADGSRLWAPGMNYRYAVETDQEVTFSSSQPGAPVPPGMRFHIQGEWNVGIVSASEARVEAQVRLVPSIVSVNVDG